MDLKIDLERDYAEILRQRLSAAGYPAISGESDEDTIARYLNVLRRKIEPKKRATKKSRTFSVPPEYQEGFDSLVRESEAGGSLRPYQSTGVENDTFDDGLFNDFGVHHFHLGVAPHPQNPAFKARSGPLLYSVVTSDVLYCLFVLPHQQWSNQMLLDIMHEDFPELLKDFTIKNDAPPPPSVRHTYTDAEVKMMRDNGINTITTRWDGKLTIGRGGGVTLSKKAGQKGLAVVRAGIDVRKHLKQLQAEAVKQISEHPDLKKLAAIDLRLTEKNGILTATDSAVGLDLDLDLGPNFVKPL